MTAPALLTGFRHGRIAALLTARLVAHVQATGAALVVVGEAAFKLAAARTRCAVPISR